MAIRRTVILAAAGAVVVVTGAAAVWLYLRPQPSSECAIVHDMISYSQSENQRMRELIPSAVDEPQKLVDAYQARETRMRQYASQIHDPAYAKRLTP